MHGRMMILNVVGMLAIGGCAGTRSAQEVDRLKSDIGLLDQRVAQLERASMREPVQQASTVEWPSDTQAASAAAAPVAPAPAQPAVSVSAKPSKRDIQQALKNAGFYQGSVDGKIGPQTREAIRTFQQIHGLKADGVVGRQTWEKLAPYLEIAAGTSEVGATESTIK